MRTLLSFAIMFAAAAAWGQVVAVTASAPEIAPAKAPPPNTVPKELGQTAGAIETLAETPTAETQRTIYDGGNLVVNPPGAPVTAAPGKGEAPGLSKPPEVGAAKEVAAPEAKEEPRPPWNDDPTIGFGALGIFAGGFIGFALGGPLGFLLGALIGSAALVGTWRAIGYKKEEK